MVDEIEEEWLPRCVPFSGIEADIPSGILGLPPNIFMEDLVKEVIIFDNDTEDGLKTLRVSNAVPIQKLVTPDMKVANLKFFEKRLEGMQTGSGIWIVDADGNKMTRKEWFDSISPVTGQPRHTDGLAVETMSKLNWIVTGGGVQIHPSPGRKFGLDAKRQPGSGQARVDLGTGKKVIKLGDTN